MANRDRAFGFQPIGTVTGAKWNAALRWYDADASRTTSNEAGTIFVGDPVIIEADGKVAPITATPTDAAIGVAVGVAVVDSDSEFGSGTNPHADPNLQRKHLPANVAGKVLVATDPGLLMEVQEDSDGGALALTDIGLNVNLIGPTEHGSTTTGLSLFELDSSTAATTSTLQFKIVDVVKAPDNEVGNQARYIVKFNRHHYNVAGMTGI